MAEPDGAALILKSKRARALLAYLAMQPDCSASREVLSNLFWPECPDANARHSLRQCLSGLRKETADVAPVLIRFEQDVVRLEESVFQADARDVLAVRPDADSDRIYLILRSFSGEFLEGLRVNEEFGAWTSDLRIKLHHKLEQILTRVDHDPDVPAVALSDAISAARLLVQTDPFSAECRRLLISLTSRAYGPGRALAEYRNFVEFLRVEQAGEPDEGTRELVRQIEKRQPRIASGLQPMQAKGEFWERPAPSEPKTGVATATEEDETSTSYPAQAVHRVSPAPAKIEARAVSPEHFRVLKALAAATVLFAIVALLGWGSVSLLDSERAEATSLAGLMSEASEDPIKRSIPVIVSPFGNSSGAPYSVEYLRDVISDHVAKIPVVSLRSGPKAQADAYELSGQVTADFGQPILSVSLAKPDGSRVWHEKFGLGEAVSVTSDIAKRIGRELEVVLVRTEAQAAIARKDVGTGSLLLAARAIQLRGHTGYLDAGASRLLQKALKTDDDSPLALTGLAGQLIMSQLLSFRVDRSVQELAESYLTRAIGSDPNLPLAHFLMGLLHKARGNGQLAIASLNRAIELNPSFAPAYANLGHAKLLLGHMDEALQDVNYAIRISPNDPFVADWYLFAGEIEFERGNTALAIDRFRSALTRAPHLARAHAWIAGAYQVSGEHDAAAASIRQFRAMLNVEPYGLMQRLQSAPEGGLLRSRPKLHQAVDLAARKYL